MKTSSLIAGLTLIAVAASASAQTGTPSAQETGSKATTVASAPIETSTGVGSYARYLMLNGVPQDEAVAQARNIDRPAEVRRFAWRSTPKTAATPVQQ